MGLKRGHSNPTSFQGSDVLIDEMQNERLTQIENRLRQVEDAVVELAVLTRFVKVIAVFIAAGLGMDLTEVL
jgi:hypothetical protein